MVWSFSNTQQYLSVVRLSLEVVFTWFLRDILYIHFEEIYLRYSRILAEEI